MKREEILSYARKPKSLFTARLTRSGAKDSADRFTLRIRNDVQEFSKKDKWQYIWVEKLQRLYVGYEMGDVCEYTRQDTSDFCFIIFSDPRLSKYIGMGETKNFYLGTDTESGWTFIDLGKKEEQQKWQI